MSKIKFLLVSLIYLVGLSSYPQCVGDQTYTVSPVMVDYPSGSQIQICYTMNGWDTQLSNWVEGFEVSTSLGLSNLTPIDPPSDCFGDGDGWIWSDMITSSNTGISAGPGWFYDLNGNGNPGDDFGDNGNNCIWSFCFLVEVVDTCYQIPLSVSITVGGDGTWGSWVNNTCALDPFNMSLGQNEPTEFESTPTSSLIDSICVGGSTVNSILETPGSIFYPNNPIIQYWNSVGSYQSFIAEETEMGCVDTIYFSILVLDTPLVNIQPIDMLCSQDNVVSLLGDPIGGLWFPFGDQFDPEWGSSWVYYLYTNQYGCYNVDSTYIGVNPNPEILEINGPDSIVNCNNSDRINNYYVPLTIGSSYYWNLNGIDHDIHSNSIILDLPNISDNWNYISVYEINQFGCVGPKAEIMIFSERCGEVYVPNTFSPNGDNWNDVFKVSTNSSIDDFDMSIYDRFGSLIYQFEDQSDFWNGNNYSNDVYIYRLKGKLYDKFINKSGSVTLLR